MDANTLTVPTWTLGWRLRRALEHANISVQDMARELGVDRRTVSTWANDRRKPSRANLVVWALRTGVPLEWLERGDDPDLDANGMAGKPTRRYLPFSVTRARPFAQVRAVITDLAQHKPAVARLDAANCGTFCVPA